ncbi:MAG: outer membrane protein assembly factor BamE [Bdellovibrionales bacterium]
MKKSLFLALVLLAVAACQPIVANRGNMVDDERLEQIKVGETDQATVQSVLGPPTMIGTFDTSTWYYSGMRTKRMAFFDPRISEERTLAIVFDESGIVKEITNINPDAAEKIKPVARKTPTGGHDMTMFEQLMDNFSRPALPGALGDKRRQQPGGMGR